MHAIEFERIEPLIAPPTVLPNLLRILSRPEVNLDQIVGLVKLEPGLVAKLLRLCNSAYFGGEHPTADLREAIQRVGLDNLCQFVVAVVCERSMRVTKPEWGFDIKELWRHSVLAGFAAEMLARDFGEDSSLLFAAGLLHDFGKLVFAVAFEATYGRMVRHAQGNSSMLLKSERELFKIDHAELGGQLLSKWNFPQDIVCGVRLHHTPATADSIGQTSALVTVADVLAHLSASALAPASPLEIPGMEEAYKRLDISQNQSATYRERILGQIELIQKVIGVQGIAA